MPDSSEKRAASRIPARGFFMRGGNVAAATTPWILLPRVFLGIFGITRKILLSSHDNTLTQRIVRVLIATS